MFVVDSMKHFIYIHIIFLTCLFSQENNVVRAKKISNRIQVTVSGNHPDAINDKPTIIYDNTKNIDVFL